MISEMTPEREAEIDECLSSMSSRYRGLVYGGPSGKFYIYDACCQLLDEVVRLRALASLPQDGKAEFGEPWEVRGLNNIIPEMNIRGKPIIFAIWIVFWWELGGWVGRMLAS